MNYEAEHKLKRAVEYETEGKNLHAVQLYNSIIDEFPNYSESYVRLASLFESSGQLKSAKDVYKTALKKIPQNIELAVLSAEFFIKQKLWQDALNSLINFSPDEEPIVAYYIGISYFNLKDYELSKLHLLKFIISDEQPELIHQAYLYLAKIEYSFKDFEKSMKFIRKSELLLKDYWEVHFVQAKIMYQLKMYTNAAKEIKFALKLNNKERIINLWAGRIFFKCGEYDKSEKHFNNYIEKESSVSTETQLEYIDVLQKQKKFSEALKHIEEALSLDPGNSDILEKKINLSGNIQLK